jgi:hypothetical protein
LYTYFESQFMNSKRSTLLGLSLFPVCLATCSLVMTESGDHFLSKLDRGSGEKEIVAHFGPPVKEIHLEHPAPQESIFIDTTNIIHGFRYGHEMVEKCQLFKTDKNIYVDKTGDEVGQYIVVNIMFAGIPEIIAFPYVAYKYTVYSSMPKTLIIGYDSDGKYVVGYLVLGQDVLKKQTPLMIKERYFPLESKIYMNGRMNNIQDVIAELMEKKNAKETTKEQRLEIVSILTMFAMTTENKGIFLKALDGVDMNDIVGSETGAHVETCCELVFKGDDIDKIRKEYEEAKANKSKRKPAELK